MALAVGSRGQEGADLGHNEKFIHTSNDFLFLSVGRSWSGFACIIRRLSLASASFFSRDVCNMMGNGLAAYKGSLPINNIPID